MHLYLDGVDVTGTVTNQTMVNNTQPLVIGQSTGTAYLKGSVDEVALYNTRWPPHRSSSTTTRRGHIRPVIPCSLLWATSPAAR